MTPIPAQRPLLTIAIPTYNRRTWLEESLTTLLPQLAALPQVELRILDNASTDSTPEYITELQRSGVPLHYLRRPENLGPDRNIADCFLSANGRYVWVLSDDDIVLPDALARVVGLLEGGTCDIVYLTDFSFEKDFMQEYSADPYRRSVHVIEDRAEFTRRVNIMFTFISCLIANKERFDQIPHQPVEEALGSYLVQLSWILPLLAQQQKGLIVYERVLAARQNNSTPYSFGRVFGSSLSSLAARYLASSPKLKNILLHYAVRAWMPARVLALLRHGSTHLEMDRALGLFRQAYGRQWRFWYFVWPAFVLPLPLASLWVGLNSLINKLLVLVRSPAALRKVFP